MRDHTASHHSRLAPSAVILAFFLIRQSHALQASDKVEEAVGSTGKQFDYRKNVVALYTKDLHTAMLSMYHKSSGAKKRCLSLRAMGIRWLCWMEIRILKECPKHPGSTTGIL
jgi:hypothetical protein